MPEHVSADIVFCIDASGSMKPCIDAVRENIDQLLRGITDASQCNWDVRFDFLAFHHSNDGRHWYRSVKNNAFEIFMGLYHDETGERKASFFTRDTVEFCKSMDNNIVIEGEEQQLFALDTAMDFPWRCAPECRRVVVLLTDEPIETGCFVAEQLEKLSLLIDKANRKRIKLFIIAPESQALYTLAVADRCEYMPYDGEQDGLRNINFTALLKLIGGSITKSRGNESADATPIPSYDQLSYGAANNDSAFSGS